MQLDAVGLPYIVFSVRHAASSDDPSLHFHYARFDGKDWHEHEMAHAGTRLYWNQIDYTGLAALDPRDPNTLYLSTDADPQTGAPLVSWADGAVHHEIFRGRTADRGATWTWEALTEDSATDNLRPVVATWDGHLALLWLRGEYHSMLRYEQDVVGLIDP